MRRVERRGRCLQPGGGQNRFQLSCADHGIHFRHILADLVAIALHQAAGHDQLARIAGDFVLGHLQDGVDRFLLGFIDERAGVHHQDVRRLGTVRNLRPGPVKQAHHDLAVDQVFGATQAYKANARALFEHGYGLAGAALRQLF